MSEDMQADPTYTDHRGERSEEAEERFGEDENDDE